GVAFLKDRQAPDGSWAGYHSLGMTSLCAWTLLEAGVPKTDPKMEKAIAFVRDGCLKLDYTYAIATTIFFLDRLGDPADVPLIEALSAQLLASVSRFHGWTYSCLTLTKEDQDAVRERVKKIKEKLADPDAEKEKEADKP